MLFRKCLENIITKRALKHMLEEGFLAEVKNFDMEED